MTSAQTIGLSVASGITLFAITLLFGWLSVTYNLNSNLFKWLLLPTLGYCFAFGINCIVQYTSCGYVLPGQMALGTLPVLYSILFFLVITLLRIVRSPISVIVPVNLRIKYGGLFALAFYMFWAGMFGEAFSGGFAQGCGSDP
jgi:hypothetical protein